jgi:hypothetical protein
MIEILERFNFFYCIGIGNVLDLYWIINKCQLHQHVNYITWRSVLFVDTWNKTRDLPLIPVKLYIISLYREHPDQDSYQTNKPQW